ncbi:MAG: PQQ-dependent sugar dehydrogenase, partial [Burkholderiales bacterium]|nr:PQQ-dependent sugar dehydrogenase [Burkholderiales bacterium]
PALLPLPNMRLPPGFKAEIWASGIADARSLRLGDKGTVFVGTALSPGAVYAVVDKGDHREIHTVVSGLDVPNGIEFLGGALYVATSEAVLRYDSIESRLDDPPPPVVLGGLPPADAHRARYLRFGPDGKLYISIGAPCNVCEPGAEYAKIIRMNRDGSGVETVARGVRNSMGMDFDPITGDLWFTDNGRDWLSENLPNDTLSHVARRGQDFGFPYCDQGDLPDPIYGWGRDCSQFAQPAQLLGPHAAPLGLRFYNGAMFPARYKGAMFIARHGPWNRTRKFGADIVAVWPDAAGGVAKMEPFMSGWVENNQYLGRPVDLLVLGDGSLLVSDDYNGAIYRISYAGA